MIIIEIILAMFILEYVSVKIVNKISNGQFFKDLWEFVDKILC